MTQTLELPPYATEADTKLYWSQKLDAYNAHTAWDYVWKTIRSRHHDNTDYFMFPDGTVVSSVQQLDAVLNAAAREMGFKEESSQAPGWVSAYENVPIERAAELLTLGALTAQVGEHWMWVEPVDDPFTDDEWMESL